MCLTARLSVVIRVNVYIGILTVFFDAYELDEMRAEQFLPYQEFISRK